MAFGLLFCHPKFTRMAKHYKIGRAEDKPFFGSYLNLAQHNAYLILNEINEKLAGRPIPEEGLHKKNPKNIENKIWSVLSSGSPEEKLRALDFLLKHFPFLRAFVGEDAQSSIHPRLPLNEREAQIADSALIASTLLRSALGRLNEERNFYSHYYDQNRSYTSIHWYNTLTDDYGHALDHIQNEFVEFLGTDGSDQRDKAHRLYADLNNKSYNEFKKHMIHNHDRLFDTQNPQQLTERGLVFLVGLFLDKKQSTLFLSGIYGLKDTRTPKERLVRAMYQHYNCRIPQPRLHSADPLLDMLGELRKAPRQLQELLTEEQKIEQDPLKPILAPQIITDEPNRVEEFFRNSREDRFAYLALRYFDQAAVFPHLRFQLHIGKLAKDHYPKKMQGEDHDRYLLKDIHTFMRLSEISPLKVEQETGATLFYPGYDESGIATNELIAQAGQIVQYSPQYNFGGTDSGRIALKLTPDSALPKVSKEDKKGRTIYSIENSKPDAIISVHELGNLFLYDYLYPNAEEFIRTYLETLKQFFQDLKNKEILPVSPADIPKKRVTKKDLKPRKKSKEIPYKIEESQKIADRKKRLQQTLDEKYNGMLHWSFLPDEVVEYLIGYHPVAYRKATLNKLKELRTDTQQRIRKLEAIANRLSEDPTAKTIRQGSVASWLARDIVYLKPNADPINPQQPKQGKPNNDQYRRMQRLLALYGGHRQELPQFFGELGLISGAAAHPFLAQVCSAMPQTLFSFYDSYLKQRAAYLGYHVGKEQQGNYYTVQKQKGIYDAVEGVWDKAKNEFKPGMTEVEIQRRYGHLFDFRLSDSNNLPSAIEKDYGQAPIFLPKGLFNASIRKGFRALGIEVKPEGSDHNDTPAFCLEKHHGGDTQPFYTLERNYQPQSEHEDWVRKFEVLNKAPQKETRIELLRKLKIEIDKRATELDKNKNAKKPMSEREKQKLEADRKTFGELRGFYRYVIQTEAELHHSQHHDRILWLMAKHLSEQRINEGTQVDMQAVRLGGLNEFLDSYAEMSVDVLDKKKKEDTVAQRLGTVAQRFLRDEQKQIVRLGRTITDENTGKVTNQQIPKVLGNEDFVALSLKQYGDLRRFAKDRRLPELFQYFPGKEFSKQQLERALHYLDENRDLVLGWAMTLEKIIHLLDQNDPNLNFYHQHTGNAGIESTYAYKLKIQEFEKEFLKDKDNKNNNVKIIDDTVRVSEKYLEEKEKYFKDNPQIPYNYYTSFLLEKFDSKVSSVEAKLLLLTRNKIMHNEIPYDANLVSKLVSSDNDLLADMPSNQKPENEPDYLRDFMHRMFVLIRQTYHRVIVSIKPNTIELELAELEPKSKYSEEEAEDLKSTQKL